MITRTRKTTPVHASQQRSFIEPLETRIAPALLVNGANLLGGTGHPHTGETSVGTNAATLVNVTSGEAIVWYNASLHEIVGISVGPNVAMQIAGNIHGDIVANLTAAGRLSDSDNNAANGEDGAVLLANNILSIKSSPFGPENGDIGHILTAGSVSNLQISGQIGGIYAGDGAFKAGSSIAVTSGVDRVVHVGITALDVNPIQPGSQSGFDLSKSASQFPGGGSITNVSLQTGRDLQIFAGDGFNDPTHLLKGGAGGGIFSITIQSAFSDSNAVPSYSILAGDGGGGLSGGAGGSIVKVIEMTSDSAVSIVAGNGGNGTASKGGTGGAGGSITMLDLQSDSTSYSVRAGAGGSGSPAGAGGSLTSSNFSSNSPASGIILSGDFVGPKPGGDGIGDVLVIDSGSGNMVLLQNTGPGTSFDEVQQDVDPVTFDPIYLIKPQGTTPVSAVAVDVNNDGFLDVVVAYQNSNSIGVFLNDGTGVFTGSSISLGASPSKIVTGNFIGDNNPDLAVLTSDTGHTKLSLLQGTGLSAGSFTLVDRSADLGPLASFDMKVARIDGNSSDDLFVGLKPGTIVPVLTTGDPLGPFAVQAPTVLVDPITNLDVDSDGGRLLTFQSSTNTLSLYSYGATGALSAVTGPDISAIAAKPVLVEFIPTVGPDSIAVLANTTTNSELDTFQYDAVNSVFTAGAVAHSNVLLKNFAAVDEGTDTGVAALGGSLSRFSFSQSYADFNAFSLPFAGKSVNAHSGDGGFGLGAGNGGAGGNISNINIQANDATIFSGHGGNSVGAGAGGAGGSITNASSMTTSGGTALKPMIVAEETLDVTSGYGGSPGAFGKTARGGAGGGITGMMLTLSSGDISVLSGHGGDGNGGLAGSGGNVVNLNSTNFDGSLFVTTGDGGNALSGNFRAGSGGSISGLTDQLTLSASVETLGNPYDVTLTTGHGGNSAGSIGGAGGAISKSNLTLDPSNLSLIGDSTTLLKLATGFGGDGTVGGAGGAIGAINAKSVFDEIDPVTNTPMIDPVAADIRTGHGGKGTAGAGGAGGSIGQMTLQGITDYHPLAPGAGTPALLVIAGNGGDGTTNGGGGGAINTLIDNNVLISDGGIVNLTQLRNALFQSGDGGDGGSALKNIGGAGGAITGLNVGVERGPLALLTGNGGSGNVGGAGGAIGTSSVGAVKGNSGASTPVAYAHTVGGNAITGYGTLLSTGHGGDGIAQGGAGGAINTIALATPQDDTIFASLVYAGKGGNASGAGAIGGNGGGISGITSKDLNGTINVLQSGDGGAAASGTGGLGGSVGKVTTAGFIGKPADGGGTLGVFDNSTGFAGDEVAQGIFVGRGGAGLHAGTAGSVASVIARQIAAIAATVDSGYHFGVAASVSKVTADIIGYDVDGLGFTSYPNTTPGLTPSGTRPVDGFILAAAISQVNTLPGHTPFEFGA